MLQPVKQSKGPGTVLQHILGKDQGSELTALSYNTAVSHCLTQASYDSSWAAVPMLELDTVQP